jgi:hypothetical protein
MDRIRSTGESLCEWRSKIGRRKQKSHVQPNTFGQWIKYVRHDGRCEWRSKIGHRVNYIQPNVFDVPAVIDWFHCTLLTARSENRSAGAQFWITKGGGGAQFELGGPRSGELDWGWGARKRERNGVRGVGVFGQKPKPSGSGSVLPNEMRGQCSI